MPNRYELWDFSFTTPTCRGGFQTKRHAYRLALRLGLRAFQVLPAAGALSS